MAAKVSAVDAVSPAFKQAVQQLFQPFRFGVWARLGVVSLATGEFAGGSWGGGNINVPSGGGGTSDELLALANPVWEEILPYLPWILFGVAVLVGLGLIFIYVASVFRFILLDAVLNQRYRLREGWRRWQAPGSRYFLWQIGFNLAMLLALAALIGLPLYLAWQAGLFRRPDEHFGLLFGGGALLFFLLLGLVLLSVLIALLAKDFLVPLMALENLGVFAAWGRLLPILGGDKMAFTGYVLMKIVLAVGSAILFGIVNVIVLLILIFVLGIAALGLVLAATAAGLAWNLHTIGAAVLLGLAALGLILYVMALVSAPAVVFFQSYTLHFFAARYPMLAAIMTRPLPPGPSAPAPVPAPAS